MNNTNGQTGDVKRSNLGVGIGLGLVFLVAGGVYFLTSTSSKSSVLQQAPTKQVSVTDNVRGDETITNPEQEPSSQMEIVNVEGGMFYFKPDTITVKKGEKVKIIFNNVEGTHDFVIDELNVKSELVKGPATTEVEFTPQMTGTFEYYCSVGNHRTQGMKGMLIVE